MHVVSKNFFPPLYHQQLQFVFATNQFLTNNSVSGCLFHSYVYHLIFSGYRCHAQILIGGCTPFLCKTCGKGLGLRRNQMNDNQDSGISHCLLYSTKPFAPLNLQVDFKHNEFLLQISHSFPHSYSVKFKAQHCTPTIWKITIFWWCLALNTFSSLSLAHTHTHWIKHKTDIHRHNNCLLTDSWFLSFASYTVSLTSVSGLAGYSEGKVTPVRNSGSLFACHGEGHRTEKQGEILSVYLCHVWHCVTLCTCS